MSHFETLGLTADANEQDIKRAYRRLASKFHPDKQGGDLETFQKIQKAYDALESRVCPVCEGKGQITERNGAFVKHVGCPRCWGPH
jgi:DnaJ-class molecular chaperone